VRPRRTGGRGLTPHTDEPDAPAADAYQDGQALSMFFDAFTRPGVRGSNQREHHG
jgi:hypothetical protein